MPSRQQAGDEGAEGEERRSREQATCGKGVLHPVGKDGTEKAVKSKTGDNAHGHADERDARRHPQNVSPRRAKRQADAELRSAPRDAVSNDAKDTDQRKRERHGREDAKQDRVEPLAAVLIVTLDEFFEDEGTVRELLVRSDRSDSDADRVQVGERIALGADEELHVGLHHGGVRNVDGGDDGGDRDRRCAHRRRHQ